MQSAEVFVKEDLRTYWVTNPPYKNE